MKRLVLLSAVLLFVTGGLAFSVDVDEVEDTAKTDEPALFDIKVTNEDTENHTYTMSIHDYHRSSWYSHESRIEIEPGSSDSFNLEISPGRDAIQDRYSSEFTIRERGTDETLREEVSFRVTRDRELNMERFAVDEGLYDPGGTVEVTGDIRNVGSSTVDNPVVTLEGLNNTVEKELGPITAGGLRAFTEEFKISEQASPGSEEITLTVEDRQYTESFNVSEVNDLEERYSSDNKILVVENEYYFENRGNVEKEVNHSEVVPSYIEPLFYAPGAETAESENGTVYAWNMQLQPGEASTIETRTDYWMPVAGLTVLLAGLVALKRLTSGVSVTKKINSTEGEIEVTIEVENSSSRTFDDVIMEDYIPNVAEVNTDFEMASPEVKHEEGGTQLRWWINDLTPGDQRVYKYSLTPKVEVEGGVTLEPAEIRDGEETIAETDEKQAKFTP